MYNTRGSGLVEIVIATALIGIAFVALISLFTMSADVTGYTGRKTDMTMVAQDIMEYTLNEQAYGELLPLADGIERDVTGFIDSEYSEKYQAARIISVDDAGRLMEITVKVKSSQEDYSKGVILVTQRADIE